MVELPRHRGEAVGSIPTLSIHFFVLRRWGIHGPCEGDGPTLYPSVYEVVVTKDKHVVRPFFDVDVRKDLFKSEDYPEESDRNAIKVTMAQKIVKELRGVYDEKTTDIYVFERCRLPTNSPFYVLSYHALVVWKDETQQPPTVMQDLAGIVAQLNAKRDTDWKFDTAVYGTMQRFGIPGTAKHVPAVAKGNVNAPDYFNNDPKRFTFLPIPSTQPAPPMSKCFIQTGRIKKVTSAKTDILRFDIPASAMLPLPEYKGALQPLLQFVSQADVSVSAKLKAAVYRTVKWTLAFALHDYSDPIVLSDLTYTKRYENLNRYIIGTSLRHCPYAKRIHQSQGNHLFLSIEPIGIYLCCLGCYKTVDICDRVLLTNVCTGLGPEIRGILGWEHPTRGSKSKKRKAVAE